MEKVLLIVASGMSSRFGGFPKALCDIRGRTNAENTAGFALEYFDKIYVGVNQETYAMKNGDLKGCEMISIEMGYGDAHSLLRCLNIIKDKEPWLTKIAVCWGDAVFKSSRPFQQLIAGVEMLGDNVPIVVACAKDKYPYAWFDLENGAIKNSHFAKDEGVVEDGIHDQSLFYFDLPLGMMYLEAYRDFLGITEAIPNYSHLNEMKLLHLFDYIYANENYQPAKICLVDSGNVLSFNTREELDAIIAGL